MMMIVMIRMMMKNLVHHERDVVVLADLRQASEERWRPVVVASLGLERLPGYQECLENTYIRQFYFTHTQSQTPADNHTTCVYKHLL